MGFNKSLITTMGTKLKNVTCSVSDDPNNPGYYLEIGGCRKWFVPGNSVVENVSRDYPFYSLSWFFEKSNENCMKAVTIDPQNKHIVVVTENLNINPYPVGHVWKNRVFIINGIQNALEEYSVLLRETEKIRKKLLRAQLKLQLFNIQAAAAPPAAAPAAAPPVPPAAAAAAPAPAPAAAPPGGAAEGEEAAEGGGAAEGEAEEGEGEAEGGGAAEGEAEEGEGEAEGGGAAEGEAEGGGVGEEETAAAFSSSLPGWQLQHSSSNIQGEDEDLLRELEFLLST